ncbi:hypothetical protein GCM10008107_03100 [Psychrosphaera saromensis]|uniref:Cadherin domain-containing protein n=1 Tax=Psychrosphaera saromensis TaxID=716813 RepID=A0A2S7UXL7_9GAMM|nr:hypothetical protein [Psychrosphaera saromensis]PQJ54736.1 hypothetical protein BTO11_14475 [Psychrosphaera saromensis]GHB57575.1 hypothetical protein GCM10008107_03100 [Psychrosphaera saromensis]GLQ14032.1 hypothetical protein GCM10007917_14870 [Psychrosphaera saromensis]
MFKPDLHIAKLILFISVFLLSSCSSDDDDSDSSDQTFSVALSTESFEVEVGEQFEIELTITKDSDVNVSYQLNELPDSGIVVVNSELTLVIYVADETLGNGSFEMLFESDTMSLTKTINYIVIANQDTTTDIDIPTIPAPTGSSDDYTIRFPSDYLTIFENESITFDIKRNYEQNDNIEETFYFNAYNVTGRVSADKSQITLKALDGNEDTYGEVTAVTNALGERHESKMYIIYFNKNRDLTTNESPLIALLDTDITISPYSSTKKVFDIYDPDSDRISYRILSAPNYIGTHINKTSTGFDLTINTIDDIDATDNELVLEVSDAYNTDTYTFSLVETTTTTDTTELSTNTPPDVFIEKNVAISLIKKMDGTETGIVAELAFATLDAEDDNLDVSVSSSNEDYTFRVEAPYIYVSADDLSDLQHDQITITASDEQFDSKLTYHLYISDNYAEFLGGNPNTAPFTDLPTSIDLLEGKTVEIDFTAEDFESHSFELGVYDINGESSASITGTSPDTSSSPITGLFTDLALTIAASSPSVALTTQVTVWLEDIFESRREHVIDVNIYKNSAPTLTLESDDITFDEDENVDLTLTVDDFDEPNLQPTFTYDTSKLNVVYSNGVLTISSEDLTANYTGGIDIYVVDEFGESDTVTISVLVNFI